MRFRLSFLLYVVASASIAAVLATRCTGLRAEARAAEAVYRVTIARVAPPVHGP